MSFSSGTFSINSAGQPVVTGTVISSTAFNALTADLATGLSTCVLKDGTQTLTANLPMSGFKLTGLGAGTANGNSIRWEQSAAGVLTTTGDILYASSANTPARLAVGTADLPLVVNAGATAPQWGFATKTANTVYAGPTSGGAAAPAFRALVAADLGSLGSLVRIQTQAASNSATVDFTTGISSTYDEYLVTITDMVMATDNTTLQLRVSEDGGSTFKSGGSDYAWTLVSNSDASGTAAATGSTGDTKIALPGGISNSKAFCGELRFFAPSGTSRHKMFLFHSTDETTANVIRVSMIAGVFMLDTNAINGIRFLSSSGNITIGTFSLYGIRKS